MLITKDACINYYDALKSMYLVMDVFGKGLGAGLLQMRECMNCGHDEVLDDVALCPIAFTSKDVSHMNLLHQL